jgi:hypothetical protein
MRSIRSAVLVAALAMLVLGVAGATSAMAAQWYVNGKALSGSAKLATAVKVEEPIVLTSKTEKITGETLKIKCTSAALDKGSKEPDIVAPSTAKFVGMALEGCTLAGLKGCSMESYVGLESFEGKLTAATAPEDSAEFKQTEKYLSLIPFSGTSCAFAGEGTFIWGKFTMKATKGQEEKTEQEFVGEGEASSGLEIVGWGSPHPPVYVTGKFKLKLESGQTWSFH